MFDMQSGVVISILVVTLLIPLIAVNANVIDSGPSSPLSVAQPQNREDKNVPTKAESPLANSENNTGPNNQPDGKTNDNSIVSETKEPTAKPDQGGDLGSDDTGNNVTGEGEQDGDYTKQTNTSTNINNTDDNVEHASNVTNSDSTTGNGNKTEPSLANSAKPTEKDTTNDQSGGTGETNKTSTAGSSVGTTLGRGTTDVVGDNSINAEVITQQPTNESQHYDGQPASANISKESTPTVLNPDEKSPPSNDPAVEAVTTLEKLRSSTPSNGERGDAGKTNPTQQPSDDSKVESDSRNGDAGRDISLDEKTPVVSFPTQQSSDSSETESTSRNGGAEKTPGVSSTASTKEPKKDSLDKPLKESDFENNDFYDADDDPFDESQDSTVLQNPSKEHDSGRNNEVATFPDEDEEEEGESHFFAFILTAMFCTAAMYLLYHNKRKVAAFVFPGAQRRTGMRHRSGHKANYERLQSKPDGGTYVF